MKKRTGIILCVFLLTGFIFAGPSFADDMCSEPVSTSQGLIKGMDEPEHEACVWKGIPYAAPPVGELRWKAPQPPEPHEGVRSAYEFGPACMQKESFFSGGKSISGLSEDCLTLNIWAPQKSGKFPVMYWIHGGGLTIGSSNYEMYEGARLAAERDVVMVSVNYRLAVFGFFAHPDLADEDRHGSTGNYGMMDQIAGLEWIRDNIAGFRGDPDNVTIFGESAGGLSVCNLLASPPAAGLFHRAIIESGGCDLTSPIEKGLEKGEQMEEALGCEGPEALNCMRDVSAEDLLEMKDGMFRFGSHVDGYVIPDVPIEAIRKGEYNRVPLMVGNTRDEVKLFLYPTGLPLLPGFMVKKGTKKILGDRYDEVMAMYPRSEYGRPVKRVAALASEGFGSRGFMAAEDVSVLDPVYYYSFDWDDYLMGKTMGAFHGLEIPFVFGNVRLKRDSMRIVFRNKKVEAKARPLSDDMMSFWANFAKTGDPNGPGLPEWPAYDTETRERIHLDTEITSRPLTDDEIKRYRYWAELDISTRDLDF